MANGTMNISTPTPSSLANQIRTGLNKELIAGAEKLLNYNRFVSKTRRPKQQGEKTFRFFIRQDADASRVSSLTEGAPINTFIQLEEDYVDVTAAQFGEAMKITDIAADNTLWDYAMRAKEEFAADAALKWDDTVKGAIVTGLKDSDTLGVELFAGVAPTGDTSADYTSLYGLSTANAKITEASILAAKATLVINGAPMINGDYVAQLPAQVEYDLLQDSGLRAVANYQQGSKQVYDGEVGRIYGVRFLTTNNPSCEGATYGTQSTAGKNIYGVHFFGKDAFGAVSWSAQDSSAWMNAPQFIIKDKPDSADPLNQLKFVGWKAVNAACVLRKKNNVFLRVKSTRFSTGT